jgi:molecular chaperone GrpE
MEKEKEKTKEEILEINDVENINEKHKEINEEGIEETVIEDAEENIEAQSEEHELKEEISKLKDEKIRVLAEMENLRKRFDREKIDLIRYGSINFARDILSPGDNLDRALSAVKNEEEYSDSIKNLIEGLMMVKKEFASALEKNSITKIVSVNKKFDPNLHQAMMEVDNDDLDEGVVVQEIQSGYTMHDRLLRPAMVAVSKKSKLKSDVEIKPESEAESEADEKED